MNAFRCCRPFLLAWLMGVVLATRSMGLTAGDLSVIAFDADTNDTLVVVALADIPPAATIYLSDNEWNGLPIGGGGGFILGEGVLTWTTGLAGMGAGSVVAFTNLQSAARRGVADGTLAGGTGFDIAGTAEAVFLYQGTGPTNATVFLAAFGNNTNVPTTFGSLAGTGLTMGDTAAAIGGDADVAEYTGPRTGLQAADYRKVIGRTAAYWTQEDASGDQSTNGVAPDEPFNRTSFYVHREPSKWEQPPDRTVNGVDVGSTNTENILTLADDFLCTRTGPITGITVYASWLADSMEPNSLFFVGLWSDNPTNQSNPFSKPATLLCEYPMMPGSYTAAPYFTVNPGEWYYDPASQFQQANADRMIWKYYFPLSSYLNLCTVTQEEGRVYWVSVQWRSMEETPAGYWGWKSSSTHYNDDAVWSLDVQDPRTWQELRYPVGHPYAPNSMDLAFAVDTGPLLETTTTTSTTTLAEGTTTTTTSSSSSTTLAVTTTSSSSTSTTLVGTTSSTTTGPAATLDFGDAPDPTYPTLAASNGARHKRGGPWFGDAGDAPDMEADGQPNANALGDDFDGNDDEDGASFPQLLKGIATNFTFEVSGTSGVVEIWLDVNRDGVWQLPDELIHSGTYRVGPQTVAYTLPASAVEGSSFVRMRISSAGTASTEGLASDGEVEDHNVFLYDAQPDWCNTQWPRPSTTTKVDVATETIYGQVWISGVTLAAGQTPGLTAELGYGPNGSSADGNPAWVWTNAVFNTDAGENDEFMASLVVPQPGLYDYAYRYSWYGGPSLYGDMDDANGGYDAAANGSLYVRLGDAVCVKWNQAPDCDLGLDVRSSFEPQLDIPSMVADDFVSDGRPIYAVRWWGSYIGYSGEPALTNPPPTLRPIAFELRWYTDVAAGSEQPWSKPGVLITNVVVQLLPYGVAAPAAGLASERHYCTADFSWVRPVPPVPSFEHEYEYTAQLPQPWLEKDGHVYWLSVRAIYPSPASYPWGWTTTPIQYNWNDAAVIGPGSNWVAMAYPPSGWTTITNHPYRGLSVNLAFEMLTDVCPRRCEKWEQPPDMVLGTDMLSWRHAGSLGAGSSLRADDFVSDGRRITDLHWWGSYPGWMSQVPGAPDVNPVAPPTGAMRPLGFDLSWHRHDDNAGGPGSLITNIFVSIDKCHEVYYGPVNQYWTLPPGIEHEYQYDVDLLDAGVYGSPWFEKEGVHYWLNIQAVFSDAFVPELHQGWGWKITPGLALGPSTVSVDGGASWAVGTLQAPHPLAPQPFDLAFELTTPDIPGTNSTWMPEIIITNFVKQAGTNLWSLSSVGDCGCGGQVLQVSSNLIARDYGFRDLSTNLYPRAENLWTIPTTNRNAFYRVLTVP